MAAKETGFTVASAFALDDSKIIGKRGGKKTDQILSWNQGFPLGPHKLRFGYWGCDECQKELLCGVDIS